MIQTIASFLAGNSLITVTHLSPPAGGLFLHSNFVAPYQSRTTQEVAKILGEGRRSANPRQPGVAIRWTYFRTKTPQLVSMAYPTLSFKGPRVTCGGHQRNRKTREETFLALTSLYVSDTLKGLRLITSHFRLQFYNGNYWHLTCGVNLLVDFFRMLEAVDVRYSDTSVQKYANSTSPTSPTFAPSHKYIECTVIRTARLNHLINSPTLLPVRSC